MSIAEWSKKNPEAHKKAMLKAKETRKLCAKFATITFLVKVGAELVSLAAYCESRGFRYRRVLCELIEENSRNKNLPSVITIEESYFSRAVSKPLTWICKDGDLITSVVSNVRPENAVIGLRRKNLHYTIDGKTFESISKKVGKRKKEVKKTEPL